MAGRPTKNGAERKLEERPIENLIPYARNARTHSDAQVAQIAASIKEFGFTNPVLIDGENGIIAGHGRVLAARKLGIATVPCIELAHLSETQRRAYILADNKLALNAGWDAELLGLELKDLQAMDFDVSLAGFSAEELAELLADKTEGLTDPDKVPEVPAEPVSVLGDVWVTGKHRIVCGDSTDADAVAKCLNGVVVPHLMVTDPPYGVEYDPAWRVEAKNDGTLQQRGGGGKNSTGKVQNDNKPDWREAWALFPGDVAYVWSAPGRLQVVSMLSLEADRFEIRQQIIWAKEHFAMGRGNYHYQHELCWYAVRKGKTAHWQGRRDLSTVWKIVCNNGFRKESEATGHATQKPVDCMRFPIENNSAPGDAVYEPFSGSGTTIIAAEMTGRICHAIELSPAYVDIAVTRWQNFTGKPATLEGDGRAFDEIAAHRGTTDGRPQA